MTKLTTTFSGDNGEGLNHDAEITADRIGITVRVTYQREGELFDGYRAEKHWTWDEVDAEPYSVETLAQSFVIQERKSAYEVLGQ